MTKKRSEMARLSRKALESLRKAAVLTIAVIIRRGPMEASNAKTDVAAAA